MDDGDVLMARCRQALLTARSSEPAVTTSSRLPDAGAIAAVADDLLGRHDDPRRHHHTRRHLLELLAELDRLVSIDQRWWQVPPAVELAVLFHDAVYEPRRDDNEQRSAQLADTVLAELGVATALRGEVARLVLLTASHDPSGDDPAGQLLVDGDLWILAAPEQRYDQYVADVRAEYGHLDDLRWRAGRIRVLDRLAGLVDANGYWVGPFEDRAKRTVAALDNLARERATLTGTVDADDEPEAS